MKKGQVSSTNEVGTTKILYSKKPPQFLFHNISQINEMDHRSKCKKWNFKASRKKKKKQGRNSSQPGNRKIF